MWIEHQNQQNMALSGKVIQEKMSLYCNLTKDNNDPVPFADSHGWFERFKGCHAFHNLVIARISYLKSFCIFLDLRVELTILHGR
uniref:HTH CENPB-type domain-containing protein n=1 Tax=Eptatretus burgeri TaxID=7764 RepID=A0A8C4WV38_EPTBU